jgi:mono/diheme cytochrome c family protein
MRKTPLLVLALLLLGFLVSAQNKQPAAKSVSGSPLYTIPVDAAKRENPIKPTDESLARGKKQYGYDCVMCHGKNGDGKGDVAVDMKLAMNDETNPSVLKDRTDGELFYIIQKGKDQMPPEGTRVKDEAIWDMVNYVRALAKKTAVAPAADKATH